MTAFEVRVGVLGLGCAILLGAGCRQNVEDLFGPPEQGSADAAVDAAQDGQGDPAALPFADKAPYLTGEECTACMDAMCGQELDDCLADPTCSAMYDCKRNCTEPTCFISCWLDNHPSSSDPLELARVPRQFPLAGVRTCAGESCPACKSVGENFSCVGRFDLEERYTGADTIPLVHVVDSFPGLEPVAGARVRACDLDSPDCALSGAELDIDEEGSRMLIPTDDLGFRTRLGFPGVFLAEVPEQSGVEAAAKLVPNMTGDTLGYNALVTVGHTLLSQGFLESALPSVGREYDPQFSLVVVAMRDCYWDNVGNIRLEVDVDCGPAGRCVYYTAPGGIWSDPEFDRAQSDAFITASIFAPPGAMTIRGVQADTGRLVARHRMIVQPGMSHQLNLWPLTTEQWNAVPR